jgi:uncharacterized protein (TIGR00645 family)
MTRRLFQILSTFRWLMLVFCFGLAISLLGFACVFVLKVWNFLLAVPTIGEVDVVLKLLGLIDYALLAGLIVMVMLSTFSSFIENQDDSVSVSWLSSMSFGALKLKLASTIAAIGAISLLEDFFQDSTANFASVGIGLAIEIVFLLVIITFALVDYLANKSPH